jgi:hypothetical protein
MYTAFDHSLPQAQTSRRDGSKIGTKATAMNQMKITDSIALAQSSFLGLEQPALPR